MSRCGTEPSPTSALPRFDLAPTGPDREPAVAIAPPCCQQTVRSEYTAATRRDVLVCYGEVRRGSESTSNFPFRWTTSARLVICCELLALVGVKFTIIVMLTDL